MKFLFLLTLLISSHSFADFKALDAELTNYTYPFAVEYFSVKLKDQNYRMAYMDLKPPGMSKGVVVLLHGKNFSGNYWERTATDLLKADYRVLIPDQIGFGKSSKPESFPYTLQYLAQLTHDLVVSKKIERYIVIGHSMGGMLGTRLALMFPDEVEKLILVNPIGLEDWKTKIPYKTVSELYENELKNNEEKIREYQKSSYFDGQWKPEYEKGIEIAVGWTKHKDFPRIAWNSALTTDMIFTQPVVYEFKNLQMPTMLLIGTRDRTAVGMAWADPKIKNELGRYDRLGQEVVKLIPKGSLVELPGIGHLPQVESYERFLQKCLIFIRQ
jgi:pimeloyl-ACP methyl ester carboxylesterase